MADTYVIGECFLVVGTCPVCAPLIELKPGWCILHAGEREPCRKCNPPGVRRA